MCDCTYKQQADAWMAVWGALMKGNPTFMQGGNGQSSAVNEIERLYETEAAWKAAYSRVLEERNSAIDRLDAAKHERDAQNHRANAAQRERDEESGRKNHALHELDKERHITAALNAELMKIRRELRPLSPVEDGERHRERVGKVVSRYKGAVPLSPVAEAVYYLLERDQLQTAVRVKRLSERLDALELNKKQPADQCGQGFSPAPWEVQPSGGFNPG